MNYFKVIDDCVIERTMKNKSGDKVLEYVRTEAPGSNPILLDTVTGVNTLYATCKRYVDEDKDFLQYDWFISTDRNAAMCAAIVHVINDKRLWHIMQTEDDFNKWITTNVR